jgi:hypothetical protein
MGRRRTQKERVEAAADRQAAAAIRWRGAHPVRVRAAYKGADGRDYRLPPMDPDEGWLFHEWMKQLERDGKAVAFGLGSDGNPTGYREATPGQWRGELTGNQEIAGGEPGFVVDRLKDLDFEEGPAATVEMLARVPSWLRPLLRALVEEGDRGMGPLAGLTPAERAEVMTRGPVDPEWLRARLFGLQPPAEIELSPDAWAVLLFLLFGLAVAGMDQPGYDPVRDAGERRRRRLYALALAALLRGPVEVEEEPEESEEERRRRAEEKRRRAAAEELDYWRRRLLAALEVRRLVLALARRGVGSAVPGLVPPKPGPVAVLRLHHADPILGQTRRKVAERGPGGRFTGRVVEKVVPTMRIDLDSYLGRLIRVVDDDTGRSDPPRGALAVIETSRGRRQWIMPVRVINGRLSWRGKERDDPRRVKLREEQGAEVLQLKDHRTGKARTVRVLATPRSIYFSIAMEFAAEFDRLQERAKR